MTSSNW